MNQTSMSAKGQIVIPKPIRDALGIKPADKLQVDIQDKNSIVIRLIPNIEDVYGMFKVQRPITKTEAKKIIKKAVLKKFGLSK